MATITPTLFLNPSALNDYYFPQVDEDEAYFYIASPSCSNNSAEASAVLSTEEEADVQELVNLMTSSLDFSLAFDSPPPSPSPEEAPVASPQSYISVEEAEDHYEYPPAHVRLEREVICKTLAENIRPLTHIEKLIWSKLPARKQLSSAEIATTLQSLTPEFVHNLREQFLLLSAVNKKKFIHLLEPYPTAVKDYLIQTFAKRYHSFPLLYRA